MIKLDESDYIVHKIMQEIPTEFKTFMQVCLGMVFPDSNSKC